MSSDEHLVYAPYLFGYTNYARQGYAQYRLDFSNSPTDLASDVSTIMGGVGLAVSANSKTPKEAARFVEFVASADIQTGLFTESGGQPGNLIAWQDEHNNDVCGQFFNDTLKTMTTAYVRPNHPGWNHFQEQGAELIHQGVIADTASNIIINELNQLYKTIV